MRRIGRVCECWSMLAVFLLWTHSATAQEDAVAKEAESLSNIRQVTSGFPRAGEGYFNPAGTEIVYQAYPLGYPFYQIYLQPLDGGSPTRLSPGRGRTTCTTSAVTESGFCSRRLTPTPRSKRPNGSLANWPHRGDDVAMSGTSIPTWISTSAIRMGRT